MTEGKRWQKAIVVSLLVHGVVLTGIGWMFAKAFAVPDIPEQYVELELISEAPGGGMAENAAPGVSSSDKEQTASVQTVASNMSVVSAEIGGKLSDTGVKAGGEGNEPTFGGAGIGTGNGTGNGIGTGAGNGTGNGAGIGSGPGNGSGIISPSILSQVEPMYPEQARQAREEGTVVLKIQILANGRPGEVSVYRSSGWSLLDDAAVEAVRKWRFIAARERESGRAIVCYTTMPVIFRLRS